LIKRYTSWERWGGPHFFTELNNLKDLKENVSFIMMYRKMKSIVGPICLKISNHQSQKINQTNQ
jgi:hypothetical protein